MTFKGPMEDHHHLIRIKYLKWSKYACLTRSARWQSPGHANEPSRMPMAGPRGLEIVAKTQFFYMHIWFQTNCLRCTCLRNEKLMIIIAGLNGLRRQKLRKQMQTQKERCCLVGTGYRFGLEASKVYYLNNCGSPSVIIFYGRFASHVLAKQYVF